MKSDQDDAHSAPMVDGWDAVRRLTPPVVGVGEVSEITGLNTREVLRLGKAGVFPCTTVAGSRKKWFLRDEIIDIVRQDPPGDATLVG